MQGKIPWVGVFDSGVGGLTVLKECFLRLPQAGFYYFGDNARAPYGNRREEEIVSFVREALLRFEALKVDAVVLACNTATAVCIDLMRREFSFPLIGTEPAVRPAAGRCKRAVLLSTVRTASSRRLTELIQGEAECAFTVLPCPTLAEGIERALILGEPLLLSEHLRRVECDGVVLGCTHYVFVREEIGEYFHAPVFDGNRGVAKRLAAVLSRLQKGPAWSENTETNTCLQQIWSPNGARRVIFLGKSGKINEKIFERMFI